MSNLAIRVEHLTKQYRLGSIGGGTLRNDLQSWSESGNVKTPIKKLVTMILPVVMRASWRSMTSPLQSIKAIPSA